MMPPVIGNPFGIADRVLAVLGALVTRRRV
jgi:hypothetical protein